MPHAINTKTDKLIVNIGQLEKKMELPEKDLEIVFLIGIPEKINAKTEKALLNMYEFIFTLANDRKLKNRIREADSVDQVKKIMNKEVII